MYRIAAKTNTRSFIMATVASIAVAAVVIQLPVAVAGAQPTAKAGPSPWCFSRVRHLVGLPDVRPKTVGKLWVGHEGVRFESEGGTTFVESARILKVSIGDEWRLRGGAFGRFMRTGIPFGGGVALALAGIGEVFSVIPPAVGLVASLATQGSADILTIEFLDPHDGYHGAVFTMPRHTGEELPTEFLSANAAVKSDRRQDSCASVGSSPTSITLLPAVHEDAVLPAEYGVLLYEHLFDRMREEQAPMHVYRSGNPSDHAACSGWTLAMTVSAFRKGNAVERALSGPLGLFVGTTSLNYRVVVKDSRGISILDEQRREVIRGDSESLELSNKIAKSINKRVRKLHAQS